MTLHYGRLSRAARETIRWSGFTIAEYVRASGSDDGDWHGDTCGCRDDRCIGHHHDAGDECGCLPAWLADLAKAKEAHAIWHAYRAAVEANDGEGDQEADDAAWARAEKHVRRHYPHALTFSLDAVVPVRETVLHWDGEGKLLPGSDIVVVPTRGISVTYPPQRRHRELYMNQAQEGEHIRQLVWYEGTRPDGLRPLDEDVAA